MIESTHFSPQSSDTVWLHTAVFVCVVSIKQACQSSGCLTATGDRNRLKNVESGSSLAQWCLGSRLPPSLLWCILGSGVLSSLCSSYGGVLGQQLLWWTKEHQHNCDVVARTGHFGVIYQLLSDSQSNSVLRLFQQSLTRLLERVQDQMWDVWRFDCVKKTVARQQNVVLVPEQLGSGAVSVSRHIGLLVKVTWRSDVEDVVSTVVPPLTDSDRAWSSLC